MPAPRTFRSVLTDTPEGRRELSRQAAIHSVAIRDARKVVDTRAPRYWKTVVSRRAAQKEKTLQETAEIALSHIFSTGSGLSPTPVKADETTPSATPQKSRPHTAPGRTQGSMREGKAVGSLRRKIRGRPTSPNDTIVTTSPSRGPRSPTSVRDSTLQRMAIPVVPPEFGGSSGMQTYHWQDVAPVQEYAAEPTPSYQQRQAGGKVPMPQSSAAAAAPAPPPVVYGGIPVEKASVVEHFISLLMGVPEHDFETVCRSVVREASDRRLLANYH